MFDMQKRIFALLLVLLFLVSSLDVSAAVPNFPTGPSEGFADFWQNKIWPNLKDFFLGDWMTDAEDLVTFTRIVLWFSLFSIIFGVFTFLGGQEGRSLAWLGKSNVRITLAFTMSTISVMFMPFDTLMLITLGWGFVGASALLAPIYILLFLGIQWTYRPDVPGHGEGEHATPGSGPGMFKWLIARPILAFMIVWAVWVTATMFNNSIDSINAIGRSAGRSSPTFPIILSLIPYFIKRKFKW